MRYHDDLYYIYWGDPDHGIYMVTAENPTGEWSAPHLVKAGKGLIDPSPLWDDDGKAYLVHGWAGSRAGFKSVLSISEMSPDGKSAISDDVLVFDGHDEHPTVEGPKFYKRNGYYYIFAPAGGVSTGWQLVLRSKNIYGPYECRTVMAQGDSAVNGPHQGGWVDDVAGDSWFVHFQDCGAYGRIVHLQPMWWGEDDWCVIGEDKDNDGCGTPVAQWTMPNTNVSAKNVTIATSDDFDSHKLGLQWQWHANPQSWWAMPYPTNSALRINTRVVDQGWRNLWDTPNLLLQKFPAREFTTTTKIEAQPSYAGERFGLVVMGADYATLELCYDGEVLLLEQRTCIDAESGASETINESISVSSGEIYLRCEVYGDAQCHFSYSTNGKKFKRIGADFNAKAGKWIGAKVGLFSIGEIKKNDGGRMDVDWFRIN